MGRKPQDVGHIGDVLWHSCPASIILAGPVASSRNVTENAEAFATNPEHLAEELVNRCGAILSWRAPEPHRSCALVKVLAQERCGIFIPDPFSDSGTTRILGTDNQPGLKTAASSGQNPR